jgi:hypothetical protein
MDNRKQKALDAFRRARAWLSERPELTGAGAGGSAVDAGTTAIAQQFAALDSAVSDATAHEVEWNRLDRTVRGLDRKTQGLRKGLVSGQMVHVATIARVAIPDAVEVTEAFRAPRRTRHTHTLIAAAEAMADASDQYETELTGGGLTAGFPAELRAATDALKKAVDDRGTAIADRRIASKAFDEALARGRGAVDALTVGIKRKLRGDGATIAGWMQLRRVAGVGVRPAVEVPAPATPAPVTPALLSAGARDQQAAAA